MSKALKVVLVGQHDDNLEGLKEALASDDLEISALAGLGTAALAWARIVEPDIVIVVANESLARPVAVTQALTQGDPSWTVVVLAERFERELVRQVMLVGARDVLLRTSAPADIHQALVTARQADLARRGAAGSAGSNSAGRVISLVGVKGGIGKTTISVNLAITLARETARSVALVDLDLPYGDLAMLLNLKPQGSVIAALSDPAILADPELLQKQLCAGPEGVYILAAPLGGQAHEFDSSQIGPLLKQLAGLYDFVVADTPGGFGQITAAALDAADQTLFVTTPEAPTLRRSELGLRQLAAWNYPNAKLKVILNRTSLKTGITDNEVAAILSHPVSWTLADEQYALQAATAGVPVVHAYPKSELSRALHVVARQIAGLPEPPQRSWFSLLMRRPALALAQV